MIVNSSLLSAGTFYFHVADTVKRGSLTSTIDIFGKFVNMTKESRSYSLQLRNISVPSGWSFSMCTPTACLAPGITEAVFGYPPSDSGHITITIYTGSKSGIFRGDIIITDLDDPGKYTDSVHFMAFAGNVNEVENPVNVQALSLSPNITSGWLTVNYNEPAEALTIIITDIGGRVCYSEELQNASGQPVSLPLWIGDYPPGMYFITVDDRYKRNFSRFCKE